MNSTKLLSSARATLGLILVVSACSPQMPTEIAELAPTDATQGQQHAAPSDPEPTDDSLRDNPPSQNPTLGVTASAAQSETAPAEIPEVREETATAEANPDDASTSEGPTEGQLRLLASLENFGAAPELSNETWLNSGPLELAGLRGKVVLVEFWTFG